MGPLQGDTCVNNSRTTRFQKARQWRKLFPFQAAFQRYATRWSKPTDAGANAEMYAQLAKTLTCRPKTLQNPKVLPILCNVITCQRGVGRGHCKFWYTPHVARMQKSIWLGCRGLLPAQIQRMCHCCPHLGQNNA